MALTEAHEGKEGTLRGCVANSHWCITLYAIGGAAVVYVGARATALGGIAQQDPALRPAEHKVRAAASADLPRRTASHRYFENVIHESDSHTPAPHLRALSVGPPGSFRATLLEAVLVGLTVWLIYLVLRPDAFTTMGTLYDDVVYLSLGKAIASGDGYRSIHMIGDPMHAKFPPGMPAIYALLWSAGGSLRATVTAAILLNTIIAGLCAATLWWLGRAVVGANRLGTALFCIGPLLLDKTVQYFSGAVSEPLFLLGWSVSILLADRLGRTANGRPRSGVAIALGLVLAVTALVRTQGFVLIPAVLLALILAHVPLRHTLLCALSAGLPLGAWRAWHLNTLARGPVATQPDQTAYAAWIPHESLADFLGYASEVLRTNLRLYAELAPRIVSGWGSPKALALLLAALVLALAGLWLLRRRQPALVLTIGATTAMIGLWPFAQNRFLTTLLPMYGLTAAHALSAAMGRRSRLTRAAIATVTLAVGGYVTALNVELHRQRRDGPAPRGSLPAAMRDASAWVEVNSSPSDRLMVENGGAYFLRTGRKTTIAIPEQPSVGPSIFALPGQYFAQRILLDSVTIIIDQQPAFRNIATSLEAVRARCPGVLRAQAPVRTDSGPVFYRVVRNEPCLRALAGLEP